jgi:uncharacterized membrane protein (UPF0127 family)
MIKKFASTSPQYKAINCNGITIQARIADTDESRIKGLSGIGSLGNNEGMLFDFGTEQPVSFWMRGTSLNLAIAFVTKDRIIVGINEMLKDAPTHLHNSPIPVRYALEMSSGFFTKHNIAIGDKISF